MANSVSGSPPDGGREGVTSSPPPRSACQGTSNRFGPFRSLQRLQASSDQSRGEEVGRDASQRGLVPRGRDQTLRRRGGSRLLLVSRSSMVISSLRDRREDGLTARPTSIRYETSRMRASSRQLGSRLAGAPDPPSPSSWPRSRVAPSVALASAESSSSSPFPPCFCRDRAAC